MLLLFSALLFGFGLLLLSLGLAALLIGLALRIIAGLLQLVLLIAGAERTAQAAAPSGAIPLQVNLFNINVEFVAVRDVDHRVVRGVIGTEQGPRRISGPTIIDQ